MLRLATLPPPVACNDSNASAAWRRGQRHPHRRFRSVREFRLPEVPITPRIQTPRPGNGNEFLQLANGMRKIVIRGVVLRKLEVRG